MSGLTVPICQHCKRPISGVPTMLGGFTYHFECTRSPYTQNNWGPEPTFGPLPNQPNGNNKWLSDAFDKLFAEKKD